MHEPIILQRLRYEGLPLGTKIIARELNVGISISTYGTVTACSRMYRRCENNAFIPNSGEFEEWYLNNITERNDDCFFNEEEKIFSISGEIYKFYGYSYGCEYKTTRGKEYKALMRISWDNVKMFVLNDFEEVEKERA